MKTAILTSSRADYSIYLPLLKELQKDPKIDLRILAFGMHTREEFGYTVDVIRKDGFEVFAELDTLGADDSPTGITTNFATTTQAFADVWKKEDFDLVVCFGDRYEMFAAVVSTVPFNLPLLHIHGGEKTEGAIDDKFRHAITLMSKYHFTCTDEYKERASRILRSTEHVYNTGALSIDNLANLELYDITEFKSRFDIDLSRPTILITFHPETVAFEDNIKFADELVETFAELSDYQLVITMPNADTMGNEIRSRFNTAVEQHDHILAVESFGTLGYLSCMKHCKMMLGNTSSGFIEASYFPKYVINLGRRQDGRIITPNIKNCEIRKDDILRLVNEINNAPSLEPIDIYGTGDAADKMMQLIRTFEEFQR